MIKVSIIIPCYNVEKFIVKALESAINQTMRDIEIIVINDGSQDNTLPIINRYAKQDKRIKVINQKNQGLSFSRNIGIKRARGEYIQHLDGDDWLELNTCELAYNYAKKINADIVCYDLIREGEDGQYSIITFENLKEGVMYNQSICLKELYKESFNINSVSKLIKRKLYIENNILHPENISLGEDLFTVLKLLLIPTKIGKINQCLYHYKLNINSITNSLKSRKLSDLNKGFKEVEKFILKKNITLELEEIKSLKYLKIRHLGNYLYTRPLLKEEVYEKGLYEFLQFFRNDVSYEDIKNFELKRRCLYFIAKKYPNKKFYKILAYINCYLNYFMKRVRK